MTPSTPPRDEFDVAPEWTPAAPEGPGVALLPLPAAEPVSVVSSGARVEDGLDTVVCDCMQVRLGTLRECVARGCTSVETLARATGATTVCGGCIPRVAALAAETELAGGPVRLVGIREVLPDVRSFRFEPVDPARQRLGRHVAGQHVIVSARVDGRWVSRPYTITSVPGRGSVCEVSVKREPQGHFSDALFSGRVEARSFRLTAPRGDFHLDAATTEPAVFLVGGIGVTPALAVARATAASCDPRRIHVDYSARTSSALAFAGELRRIAERRDNITVRFRQTDYGERLGVSDAREYRRAFPDARFYICGPDGYQETVRRQLRRAGVRPDRIHIESFEKGLRSGSAIPWRGRDLALLLTGLVLLLAYLGQAALGVRWPWLDALQATESYRRWSGSVLLSFMAAQWVLPALRLRGWHQAAGTAYFWHRALGAVSPAVFYAHATGAGYGYLLALASVYLANVPIGLADKRIVRDPTRRERYARVWLGAHVALAFLTLGLALFHVWVVFAYE